MTLPGVVVSAAADGHATTETTEESEGFWSWLFSSDGFHAPSIAEFFPDPILFEGTIFEFNRVGMIRVIAALVLVGLFSIVASRAKVVPSRGQVMGKDRAKRFVPVLTTLFMAIVIFNIMGVIPFLNLAATSLIGLPLVMAGWVYLMYLTVGVQKHGFWGYLKTSLFPSGVPWPIYFLLTPIEFLQVFILRPATLALRLTANMMAGHLLLVLCFAASHFFFLESADWYWGLGGGVSITAGLAFTLFEIFVALLQAYVFVMLSAVYLNMALEDEH